MQELAFARTGLGAEHAAPDTASWVPPDDQRTQHAFHGAESERLMNLLDVLEAATSEAQFRALLDGPMQAVLPHRGLLYATGRVLSEPAGIAPHHLLLHRFPADYLESLRQPGGVLRSALTDRWLHTRKPVLVELLHDTRSWPPSWVQDARRHGFTNFASHAFFEASTNSFTGFCFADLPGRLAPKHAHLLRLLVPHLHLALLRIAGTGAPLPRPLQELHPHQLEILRWLHVGKTNWEISMILGMSVHNVKYHVAQLLAKLGAANRVHAVARARDRGLLDERAPGPGSPPQRPR